MSTRRQRFGSFPRTAQLQSEAASEASYAEKVSGPLVLDETPRHPYWVRFAGHMSACVMASEIEEAKAVAYLLTKAPVTKIDRLPYPASPVLNRRADDCPPFCYDPEDCSGKSCCRKSYACSE